MSTRNTKAKVKLLPLAIAFQMFLPTSLIAREQSKAAKGMAALNRGAQVANQFMQMYQMRMNQIGAAQIAAQMQNNLGLKPASAAQVPRVFSQAGCFVPEARTNKPSEGMSCDGQFDIQTFNSGQYDALLSVAESNTNDLENFLTEGHERFTTQGMGCFNKARNQLLQQLEARVQMLETFKQGIGERVELFKTQNEKTLLDMRTAQALLDGPNSIKDQRVKDSLKDYRFEDQFKYPSCKSLAGTNFQQLGQRGLRGIEKALDTNKEKMQAKNFVDSAKQYEVEIREIAAKAAKQAKRESGFGDANQVLSGIRSRKIPLSSPALVQSVGIARTKAENKFKELDRNLIKVVGNTGGLKQLADTVRQERVDVEKQLERWEINEKNKCLAEQFKDFPMPKGASKYAGKYGAYTAFLYSLKDPNISAKANLEADSSFRNNIARFLQDPDISVEDKMKKIADLQGQSNNSRYSFTTGKSFSIDGKKVGASTRLRAKDAVNLFGRECTNAFKYDKESSGYSKQDMVSAIKNYNTKFKKEKNTYVTDLQNEILNGMLNCSDDQSTGVAANSCSASATDVNKPSFCVRIANKCAANALNCHEQAQKIVKTTREDQQKLAADYKIKMDTLKGAMITQMKMLKQNFEASSRMIDDMYQMGTTYKKNEQPLSKQLELSFTNSLLMDDIDASLLIEDPEKYEAKIIANVNSLKVQVEKHNADILKGVDDEIKKYRKNFDTQLAEWNQIKSKCKRKVFQEYPRYVDDMNRQMEEEAKVYNESLSKACSKYENFRNNPCPASGDSEFGALTEDLMAIGLEAGDRESVAKIAQIASQCEGFSSDDGLSAWDPTYAHGGAGDANKSELDTFCSEGGKGAGHIYCKEYISQKPGEGCNVQSLAAKLKKTHVYCVYQSGTKELLPEGQCTGEEIEFPSVANLSETDPLAKEIREKANCTLTSKDIAELKSSAMENAQKVYLSYKRYELKGEMGQVYIAACEAGNNMDPSMPHMGTPEEIMRNMAGQQGMMGYGQ